MLNFDSIQRLIVCFGKERGHKLLIYLMLAVLKLVFSPLSAPVIRNKRSYLPLGIGLDVNESAWL